MTRISKIHHGISLLNFGFL